jgi:hypothetical protein
MRVDERSNQCGRHPPCGVLDYILTKGDECILERSKVLAELRLRPKAIFMVRPWILEVGGK